MDDLKSILDKVQADIAEIKRQYDFFFQGTRRSEPIAERRALEGTLRRISQRRIINSADQFRFNGLAGTFYTFVNLWTRTVRDMEEGRLHRDAAGILVRAGAPDPEPVDPGHLEQALEQLMTARGDCGLTTGREEAEAIRETLKSRAREICERSGGKKVEFRVSIEDGKPKVKAVTR